jgi:cation transporter-like permease
MSIPKRLQPVLMSLIMGCLGMAVGSVIGKLFKSNLKGQNMGFETVPIAILVLWLVLATH